MTAKPRINIDFFRLQTVKQLNIKSELRKSKSKAERDGALAGEAGRQKRRQAYAVGSSAPWSSRRGGDGCRAGGFAGVLAATARLPLISSS